MFRLVYIIMCLVLVNLNYAKNTELGFVNNFDYIKYAGMWYEVARLPVTFEKNCTIPITAYYEWDDANKYLKIQNKCVEVDGTENIANGRGYFIEAPTISKLEVSFLPRFLNWIPMNKGDYWVIKTDYTTYALVGSPNRKYFWVLSRKPVLDKDLLHDLLNVATTNGYDINQLIYNNLK